MFKITPAQARRALFVHTAAVVAGTKPGPRSPHLWKLEVAHCEKIAGLPAGTIVRHPVV
jgi:hypothetical protein